MSKCSEDLGDTPAYTMNSTIKSLLVATLSVATFSVARADGPTSAAPGSVQVVADNPVMGPPPSAEYVWMSGHWNSEGGQWKWIAGHWDLPPSRSAVWVAGHWVPQGGQWAWVNGAWNASETAQSPDSPPLPPGQNAAPAQGVPSPNSPPPIVAGQYAPDGQPPVVYQQVPVYGPYDYAAAYPGYYYGNPWGWGLYPALGFGLGWGFGGWGHWGHGGYGHGGSGHGGHFH